MPHCYNCGKRNPEEQDYAFENYVGDYFCSEECRVVTRSKQE